MIVLHGTGGNKDSQRKLLTDLAHAGFIGVAIDGAYHGSRAKGGNAAKATEYVDAISRARYGQYPFYYSTAWDIIRLIDYLETRDDVDAGRIALWGFSKGGIEAYLVAAADTRVAATVSCIAVQSFGWALENDAWQSRIGTVQAAFDAFAKKENISNTAAASVRRFYEHVAYGIDSYFDGPVMVPLVAPRPFLAINGDSDPRTPLPGLKLCTDAAEAAYATAGAPQNFTHIIQPNTAHKVTPASMKLAQEWLVDRLKP